MLTPLSGVPGFAYATGHAADKCSDIFHRRCRQDFFSAPGNRICSSRDQKFLSAGEGKAPASSAPGVCGECPGRSAGYRHSLLLLSGGAPVHRVRETGLPLGVTFSFLISSPTVNEVALVMLWALFGWRISLIYIGTGVLLAIFGGVLIGRLHLEDQVESYVYQISIGNTAAAAGSEPTWRERFDYGWSYTKDIFRRIWPFILVGVGLGAWIHGYAPVDFVVKYAGRGNPLAVPIAVLIAIPLYSNAAGTIPIVQALVGKGMPMGTVLVFMMAIVAISTPETIILRKVIKPKLIAYFIVIVSISIVIIGYLFNSILPT